MTSLASHDPSAPNAASPQRRTKPAAELEIRYRSEAANYVAAMIAELRQISAKAGFDKLVGALDAAYYEAYALMEHKPGTPAPSEEKTPPPPEPPHA